MPKIINFDSKDELTITDIQLITVKSLDGLSDLNVNAGIFRSIQDWQLEKHMPMFEADMTAAQKTKSAAIIAKFKK